MLPEFLYLFSCYVCLFWTVMLLINIRRNSRAQNIWILVMICLAISTYCWGIYEMGTDNYHLYTKLSLLEAYTGLMYHTFIFFYFLAVMQEGTFKWKAYLWLVPSLTIGSLSLIFYFLMGEEQAVDYTRRLLENHERLSIFNSPLEQLHYAIVLKGYYWVISVQTPIMLTYIVWRMIRYRRQLKEYYSNLEEKSLGNIRGMLAYLSLTIILSMLSWYVEDYVRMDLLTVFMGIVYFLMGYNVYHLNFTADTLACELKETDSKASQEEDSLVPPTSIRYKERLLMFEKLMNEDKIYLQNDLRVSDVIMLMQTNRTYISQMISNEYHCSFSDYVNHRRVEYAMELVRTNPNLSQEYIARQAGFLHGSSLSRAFKAQMGMTYREWQKSSFTNGL